MHFLYLRRQIIVVPLRFMDEPLKPVVDGLLVFLIKKYQNFQDGLGCYSLTRRQLVGAETAASTMALVPLS